MDTTKIKAVLLAAESKSLSKAAEAFSYTPSALSHSVDSIENILGVKLLKRSHTGVELTEEGKLLHTKLLSVIQAENDLMESAAAMAASQGNQLRIGTYSSVSVHLLPEILKGFKERHPEISISISVGDEIDAWLHKDMADVLLGIKCEGAEWLPIVRDDFVAVVPEYLFKDTNVIAVEELYNYSFITTKNIDVARNLDFKKFRELVTLSSDDDMSAVSMVQEGMGVTILPELVMKNQPKGVRVIKLRESFHRILGVAYKKDLRADSGAMKFVQYLQERNDTSAGSRKDGRV